MRITKKQLRRMIRECGEDMMTPGIGSTGVDPLTVVTTEPGAVLESEEPVTDMLVEMGIAVGALTQVVESVQNAAHLCVNCGAGIAEQAPIVDAMVAQAVALQEMLEAQVDVIQENAGIAGETVLDTVADLM